MVGDEGLNGLQAGASGTLETSWGWTVGGLRHSRQWFRESNALDQVNILLNLAILTKE